MIKNKRGFLLGEHTLKIIIAVLCLLLLFYLLFRLYSNSVDGRDLELAEGSLDELAEKMEEAKQSGEEREVFILNPAKNSWIEKALQNEWWIIAWPYENEKEKPVQCEKNYCVCICTIPEGYKSLFKPWEIKEKSLKECNSLGICKNFDEKIKTINLGWFDWEWNKPVPIEDPPLELKIKYSEGEGFTISEK